MAHTRRASRARGKSDRIDAIAVARAEQTMRVRIARDELRRLRELTHAINALEQMLDASRDRRHAEPMSRPEHVLWPKEMPSRERTFRLTRAARRP